MKRTELTGVQKIEILELASKVPPSSQMDIAAEVHCRTTKVGQWLCEFKKGMSWEEAKAFCGDEYKHLLRLRGEYVDRMVDEARATTSSRPIVAIGSTIVPAEKIRILHGLECEPDFVTVTLREGPVASPVFVGDINAVYFEVEAAASGPMVTWRAEASDNPAQPPFPSL